MKNIPKKMMTGLLLSSALLLTGCFQDVPAHDGSNTGSASSNGSVTATDAPSTSATKDAAKGPVGVPKQTEKPQVDKKASPAEVEKAMEKMANSPYGISADTMKTYVTENAHTEDDAKNIQTFFTEAGYDPAKGASAVLGDFQLLVNNAALYKPHTCDDVSLMVKNTGFHFTEKFWKSIGAGFKDSAKTKNCLPMVRIADTAGNIDVGDTKAKHNLDTLPMMNTGENEVSGFTFQHSYDDATGVDHLLVSFDHKMLVVSDKGTYQVVTRYRIDAIPSANNTWFIDGIDWFKDTDATKKVG